MIGLLTRFELVLGLLVDALEARVEKKFVLLFPPSTLVDLRSVQTELRVLLVSDRLNCDRIAALIQRTRMEIELYGKVLKSGLPDDATSLRLIRGCLILLHATAAEISEMPIDRSENITLISEMQFILQPLDKIIRLLQKREDAL